MRKKKVSLKNVLILITVLLVILGLRNRHTKIKNILQEEQTVLVTDVPKQIIEPNVVAFYPMFDITTKDANGTGFHVKYNNKVILLTNAHICSASESENYVRFGNKVHKILKVDAIHDLCALESDRLHGLKLATRGVEKLDKLLVVGYPRGVGPTVREGRAVRMELVNAYWLPGRIFPLPSWKVSTPVSPGNSGSPVCNEKGELVGVIYAGSPARPLEGLMVPLTFVELFLDSVTNG